MTATFDSSRPERLLVMAVVVGALAATITDWRAVVAVTVFAALVYVGFLTHMYGDLTGSAGWPNTIALAFAAFLGRGQRWIRAINATG
ncbi:hypothetical protein [Actinoplanes sp. NPDC026670]|uniref:hypothetical protein n=1 Tax=Actinoplanes sp. NPDC026670 TaxID=3154700 RepID=UPI0033FA0D69